MKNPQLLLLMTYSPAAVIWFYDFWLYKVDKDLNVMIQKKSVKLHSKLLCFQTVHKCGRKWALQTQVKNSFHCSDTFTHFLS